MALEQQQTMARLTGHYKHGNERRQALAILLFWLLRTA